MFQYAICSEDLTEIELHLQNADCYEDRFNLIALNAQNIEFQDEAEGTEDLHPDFSENYDLSDDLGIPSAALNNEPLILNELPDDDYETMSFNHRISYICTRIAGNNGIIISKLRHYLSLLQMKQIYYSLICLICNISMGKCIQSTY